MSRYYWEGVGACEHVSRSSSVTNAVLGLVGYFRFPLPLAFFTAVFSAKDFSLGIAA